MQQVELVRAYVRRWAIGHFRVWLSTVGEIDAMRAFTPDRAEATAAAIANSILQHIGHETPTNHVVTVPAVPRPRGRPRKIPLEVTHG